MLACASVLSLEVERAGIAPAQGSRRVIPVAPAYAELARKAVWWRSRSNYGMPAPKLRQLHGRLARAPFRESPSLERDGPDAWTGREDAR